MTLQLKKHISDDERYAEWIRIVKRIHGEQQNQAWSDYMFRLLRAVFVTNEKLANEGGFVFNWIAENYVDAALMLIRRELDKQSEVENLRNLLKDIIDHPSVLTRARYWAVRGGNRHEADCAFDSLMPKRVAGDPNKDFFDPDVVKADLDQLIADVEQLRNYAERTRAHRTPELKVDTSDITFQALHKAIADVRQVVEKYYALLTLMSILRWEPVPQFNTIAPFMNPWVDNPKTVAAKAQSDHIDNAEMQS